MIDAYSFREDELLDELASLPAKARVAFAAAAATRQLRNIERVGISESLKVGRAHPIADELWVALKDISIDRRLWHDRLHEIMDLLPLDEDCKSIWYALADDAVSSLAYAIRCLIQPDCREAVWAARRAYEAADQVVIKMLSITRRTTADECPIMSHEIVQRELRQQQADIALLREGSIEEVQKNSLSKPFLTEPEAASLVDSEI